MNMSIAKKKKIWDTGHFGREFVIFLNKILGDFSSNFISKSNFSKHSFQFVFQLFKRFIHKLLVGSLNGFCAHFQTIMLQTGVWFMSTKKKTIHLRFYYFLSIFVNRIYIFGVLFLYFKQFRLHSIYVLFLKNVRSLTRHYSNSSTWWCHRK